MKCSAEVIGNMPALAKVASLVLSVPASSAPTESVFSRGGIIFHPHQKSISDAQKGISDASLTTHLAVTGSKQCDRVFHQ